MTSAIKVFLSILFVTVTADRATRLGGGGDDGGDYSTVRLLTEEEFKESQYMNSSADPCEDFYEFTCGNFRNLYPLQEPEDVLIDQFTLLEETLVRTVHEILKDTSTGEDPVALRKARAVYQACSDQPFIDSIGMRNPEVEVARNHGGFPIIEDHPDENFKSRLERFGWNDIADIASEFGISVFFTPSLYYDTQNASRNILRIATDGMETPVQFRPRLLESYETAIEEGFAAMINQTDSFGETTTRNMNRGVPAMEILLRKLVIKLKREMGSQKSNEEIYERIANISNFMKGIYYGGYTPNGTVIEPIVNDSTVSVVSLKQLNHWTAKHFGSSIKLDWIEYVKRLVRYTYLKVDEDSLVLRPSGLESTLYGIINWVRMNDPAIVKSAALLRAFVYTAPDSDSESRTYFYEYLKATGKTIYPRWKYCSRKIMDATGTLTLGLAVTYAYQSKYFNASKLQSATALIDNLRSTFIEVIEEANWMDDTSKAAAQKKADNIVTLLGYPEFVTNTTLLDDFYKNLQISTWNHYDNAKKLRAFEQAYTLNMISKRERKAWEKSPFDANAYYNRQNNRIIFPAAMLNPLFFQGTASILDYSRIGMIISHEITHGFDSQGFFYNPQGVIEPWWSTETIQNFGLNTQCFIEQYSNYSIPEINGTMSGSGSLNENLADNGGLRNTFRALKKILDTGKGLYSLPSKTEQYTAEQMFFIGYGTMWCNTESISYLKSLEQTCNTTTNCHARSSMRVNGVVSNMEEFAEAFGCAAGTPMNPVQKCRLW